jgi:hypothetical protein
MLVAVVGLVMVAAVPLVWGLVRHASGLPFSGPLTPEQVEDPAYRPGGWRASRSLSPKPEPEPEPVPVAEPLPKSG